MPDEKANRLIKEKSPYLLQHAHNPVDWYPWGKEALSRAKNDNKPILLSIGYSTCHWCHVMAHESFENEKTAALINKNFIPIKVDREERPEIDAYYMGAVQALTGGGGWPLTVFLTPDLKPFYGGTYFPPEPKYGMPSFTQLLEFVSNLWKDKRTEVLANSLEVAKAISTGTRGEPGELTKAVLDEGYSVLVSSFDQERGGFGGPPKFPLPNASAFLLRYHKRTGKELALRSVLKTLDEMRAGGIRDHIGGGFHRYSTDRTWLVPHFEKMLYDNALLAKVYAEACQITGKKEYAEVVRETIGWIIGEMRDPGGGFYSAQDADTTKGEGAYYTWTPDEIEGALGPKDAAFFDGLYGVTKTGNFEGRTILHLEPGVPVSEDERKTKIRSKLYGVRLKRPRPGTDTKILTSWNGLAISALAFSGMVLEDGNLLRFASKAANFVLEKVSKDGRLLRRYAGGEAALEGNLEDYAFFVQGLLDLFESTSEPRWLKEAIRLNGIMVDDFEDKENGGFFMSLEAEPARLKESYDGPIPSGNSVAALNLIRLSELTGEEVHKKRAERTLKWFAKELDRQPSAHAVMLVALDLLLNGVREIVVTSPGEEGAAEMKSELFREFVPDRVLLVATAETYEELSRISGLLEGRVPGHKARAYVCVNFACKLPADSTEALRAQLASR
ncbi:MAG: thioredoxin domain-containing protein [Thaumarchaeota archaeon]|nr:thioredoxin domain-containing protein [Nitrososphaerota archaeon]